jgi:hypothetical protein
VPRRLVDVFLIRIIKGIDCGDDVPRLCGGETIRWERGKIQQMEIIRWRIDRWDPFDCRWDVRDVDESESTRDSSSGFGRLCRLLYEGGPTRGDFR